jgi:hypothetical protein
MALLLEQTASDEAGLDIFSNSEPWKKVRVLKDQATFRAWGGNTFVADSKFAGVGKIEASDEAKESGFATTARPENGNKFAGGE